MSENIHTAYALVHSAGNAAALLRVAAAQANISSDLSEKLEEAASFLDDTVEAFIRPDVKAAPEPPA